MILAAAGGHIDAVTELLHQGADPNAKRLVSSDLVSMNVIFVERMRRALNVIADNTCAPTFINGQKSVAYCNISALQGDKW